LEAPCGPDYINEPEILLGRLDELLERSAELAAEHAALLDEIERLTETLSAQTADLLADADRQTAPLTTASSILHPGRTDGLFRTVEPHRSFRGLGSLLQDFSRPLPPSRGTFTKFPFHGARLFKPCPYFADFCQDHHGKFRLLRTLRQILFPLRLQN
jgi:hypothetical protein